MELTKPQKSLIALPNSRWTPILLGLTLGLFISAFFTSNFVITRFMPHRFSSSSSSSSLASSSSPLTTTSINQLSIQLLFKSSTVSHASRNQEDIPRAPKAPGHDYISNRQQEHADPVKRGTDLIDVHAAYAETLDKGRESQRNKLEPEIKIQEKGSKPPSMVSSHSDGLKTSGVGQSGMKHADNKLSNTDVRRVIDSISPKSSGHIHPECDISIGTWVEDDTYPLYSPGSCPFVDEGFSCHLNGRPDARYTRWRWAPRDCNVPRFNGTDMLERLRGKRMVFIGDSLNRNQWESMLCMLRESLADKSRVVQVQGTQISKEPGGYAFKFLDYDCRVEYYTSHYLVDTQDASNAINYVIRLDKMDKLERSWRKANVLVFNTGHWWTSDKIGEGENCFKNGDDVHSKLDVMVAYRKALLTWARWVDGYINPQNTTVFFRGYSPVHYIGGQWNSGGQCQNETEPIYKESYLTQYPDKMQALEGVVHGMKVPVHVLNITRLSDYRKDGHPAIYGRQGNRAVLHQDCSHWCLPGLPDIWNELLYYNLVKESNKRLTTLNSNQK